jgi:hypothetical protein
MALTNDQVTASLALIAERIREAIDLCLAI